MKKSTEKAMAKIVWNLIKVVAFIAALVPGAIAMFLISSAIYGAGVNMYNYFAIMFAVGLLLVAAVMIIYYLIMRTIARRINKK